MNDDMIQGLSHGERLQFCGYDRHKGLKKPDLYKPPPSKLLFPQSEDQSMPENRNKNKRVPTSWTDLKTAREEFLYEVNPDDNPNFYGRRKKNL